MKRLFKIGDHIFGGITLLYIKPAKSYTLMLTLFMVHLNISFVDFGFRISFSIGSNEIFFKVQSGIFRARS